MAHNAKKPKMKTIGDKLYSFSVIAARPSFNHPVEGGESAFETITHNSFPGMWKIIYFWPKTAGQVSATEMIAFDKLVPDFDDRDTVLMGGSLDNEFTQLMWRRDHKDLSRLNHYSFGDPAGELVDMLGVRDRLEAVALRATFIINPENVIQHVSVNNLDVGRSPAEILRILDAIQTNELCPCDRTVDGGKR